MSSKVIDEDVCLNRLRVHSRLMRRRSLETVADAVFRVSENPQRKNTCEYIVMKPKCSTITTNEESKLFTIGFDAGYTCLGFDVCQERSTAMAKWLNVTLPDASLWGTIPGYERYRELVELCRVRFVTTGEKCPCELTPQLIGLEGKRVEIVDKWGEKRRFQVGRSTGWIPCHLELKNNRAKSGDSVMGAPFKSLQVVG